MTDTNEVGAAPAPLRKRIMASWTVRLQVVTGVAATVYLTIPQETVLGVVPPEYVAKALLAHTIVTALARMRNV
jgi:hypothetical protein